MKFCGMVLFLKKTYQVLRQVPMTQSLPMIMDVKKLILLL